MLPSSQRISREYFPEIFKKGRFFSGQNLNLTVLKKPETAKTSSRFAFSVSKKVSNKATVRNKLRRRGYAAIGEIINKITPGFLAVFVLKQGAEKLKFQEYEKEINNLLKKSGLTK